MNSLFVKMHELSAFRKAFMITQREMILSLCVLFVITFVMSLMFYLVEHKVQPDVFDSYGSCMVWAYSRYIEGGDGVFDGGPITIVGRIIAFLLGIIGIAIVAIPAGLIGSGFIDAIAEEKREKEIDGYKENLELAFRELVNVTLREYFQEHPDLCPFEKGKSGFYLPAFVPLAKVQIRHGMEIKDVFETAAKYPQFRIANLAAMHPKEENPADRLVLTHQLINTSYGCFIDRGSKITIVSPSSVLEALTGWFAHNLAMVGGFNLISKDIEPNLGDFDSFAAMTDSLKVNGYTYDELMKDKHKHAEKLKLYRQKENNRKEFLKDLRSVCKGEDSWLIFINTSIMSKSNTDEFHFTMSKANGTQPMVLDANLGQYERLITNFTEMVRSEFGYSAVQSSRYPLPAGFPAYKLKKETPDLAFNAFKVNIGAPVLLDARNLITIYRMAQSVNESLGGSGMTEYDAKYLTSRHFGLRDYNPIQL